MPCLYTILYWAWWVKWVCTWSETQNSALQLVLLKSASSNYSRQLNWFSTSTKNMLCAILCWLNEQNEQVHSENIFVWLKPDLISFFICDLCYIFWFSRPASNVLSPAFNWAKWVKWITQGQELNVSLWNRLHWIQCLQIGLRDIISYFYHQMLFLEVIFLSTLSKMRNYLVKTSKFCLGSHLIGFSTLELC